MEILDTLDVGSPAVVLRRAEAGDVPAIVGLLADDPLGATRAPSLTPPVVVSAVQESAGTFKMAACVSSATVTPTE